MPKSDDCICNAVRKSARSLTRIYDKALAPSGLRTTQFSTMRILSIHATATVSELADWQGLDQTTATRNLIVLEESGLIERVVHHDPRVKLLKLTTKGKQKLLAAEKYWQAVQQQVKASLPDIDWRQFNQALQAVETAIT